MATYAPYRYMPILKWKLGEQGAVRCLSDVQKSAMLPIAELQDRPFDWEHDRYKKTWAAHIRDTSKATHKHWGAGHEIAFDQDLNADDELGESAGLTPWAYLFQQLWALSIDAVPVVSSAASAAEINALIAVAKEHGRDRWLLRYVLRPDEPVPTAANVASWFASTLALLGTTSDQVDTVLDAAVVRNWNVTTESQTMAQWLAAIVNVAQWRSICLAGGAFPENLTGIQAGTVQIPRTDWLLFLATRTQVEMQTAPLIYGDYGIRHVVAFDDDPRMLNKTASLRYTHLTNWFVFKGRSTKTYGYGQYRGLCQLLVAAPNIFMRAAFSAGDQSYSYIAATPTAKTGSSTTWLCDGTNHHLSVVLSQLSMLTWP